MVNSTVPQPTRIADCTLAGNSAGGSGGGLFLDRQVTVIVTGCTFYGNAAPRGAGIGLGLAHLTIQDTIIAGSPQGAALNCGEMAPAIACSDFHGNAGGDWAWCAWWELGIHGNIAADPLFCGAPAGDFTLADTSACAPAHSGGCGLIGAWPVGCGATAVEPATWGWIKARYRQQQQRFRLPPDRLPL